MTAASAANAGTHHRMAHRRVQRPHFSDLRRRQQPTKGGREVMHRHKVFDAGLRFVDGSGRQLVSCCHMFS
jgi:hypothetical protein